MGDDVLLFWMVLLYVVAQLASLSAAPFAAWRVMREGCGLMEISRAHDGGDL